MNQFTYLFLLCLLLSIPDLLALSALKLMHPILKSNIPSMNELIPFSSSTIHSKFHNSKILNTSLHFLNYYHEFHSLHNFLSSDFSTFQNPTTILAFRKTSSSAHPLSLHLSNFTLFFYSIHHIHEQFLIHATYISSYFAQTSLFPQQAFDIEKQLFVNLSQSLMNFTHSTLHLFQDRNLNLDSMLFLKDFFISQSAQHSVFFFSRLHLEPFLACLSTTISQIICSGHIDNFFSCITMHTNLMSTGSVYNLVYWTNFPHITGRPTYSETLLLLALHCRMIMWNTRQSVINKTQSEVEALDHEQESLRAMRAHLLQMPHANPSYLMNFP